MVLVHVRHFLLRVGLGIICLFVLFSDFDCFDSPFLAYYSSFPVEQFVPVYRCSCRSDSNNDPVINLMCMKETQPRAQNFSLAWLASLLVGKAFAWTAAISGRSLVSVS